MKPLVQDLSFFVIYSNANSYFLFYCIGVTASDKNDIWTRPPNGGKEAMGNALQAVTNNGTTTTQQLWNLGFPNQPSMIGYLDECNLVQYLGLHSTWMLITRRNWADGLKATLRLAIQRVLRRFESLLGVLWLRRTLLMPWLLVMGGGTVFDNAIHMCPYEAVKF
jgi:hypothetical protein